MGTGVLASSSATTSAEPAAGRRCRSGVTFCNSDWSTPSAQVADRHGYWRTLEPSLVRAELADRRTTAANTNAVRVAPDSAGRMVSALFAITPAICRERTDLPHTCAGNGTRARRCQLRTPAGWFAQEGESALRLGGDEFGELGGEGAERVPLADGPADGEGV